MRKIIYLILMMVCATTFAWAQYSVKGTVTDENGEAVYGAIVMIENSTWGKSTDYDGTYSIDVAQKGTYTLVVSYVGYTTQKQAITLEDSKKELVVDVQLAEDIIGLNAVVVTGVANPTSKLESSVSISTLNPKSIDNTVFRTTAEIFRSIPGIRSEASGGEGNTNITVRGVPISAGGSKYVQLQEDGLPILLFGDIAFATSDIFMRADNSISRIEAIRGGSASILGSNTPAGIINFISKTGEVQNAGISTTIGLDYSHLRTDFAFGAPIGNGVSFQVGGFFRQGEGVRTAGYNAHLGGQLKASVTKRFDNGYARISYKMLNDRAAAYMPMPMKVSGTNENPEWESVSGYDVLHGTMHTPYLLKENGIGPDGALRRVNVSDGMHPVSNALGAEFSFELGNDWTIENRARLAFNSGRFITPFPAEVGTAAALAASVATLRNANAENATLQQTDGTAVSSDQLALRIHMFDTELNNFNNFVNDFKISKKVKDVTINVGLFKAHQNINMSWLWNSYITELKGEDARLLNVVDGDGNLLSDNGLYAYGVPAWGNCCQRNYDTQYEITAPYANINVPISNLTLDAGLRWDYGSVTGSTAGTVQSEYDINNDGTISAPESSVSAIDNAHPSPVNYDYDYLSFSLGANYKIQENMAVFARYSSGAAAKADRILFSPNIKADGSITDERLAIDYVKQAELGWKYNRGNVGLFVTGFYAQTNEAGGYEATTQKVIENDYDALGLEVEGAWSLADFSIRGSFTFTNATITDAPDTLVIDNRPRRQSPLIFNLNPVYNFGEHSVGCTVLGTASSYAQDNNQLKMPGYVVLNPYISFQITKGLGATIAANNVLDALGITESEEGSITENAVNYVRARPIMGRSISATIRYSF